MSSSAFPQFAVPTTAAGGRITAEGAKQGGSNSSLLSLADVIGLAQKFEPAYAAASAAQRSAALDRAIAKASLLPSVTYHNQVLFTQSNGQTNQGGQVGTQSSPIFIANNAVHEYVSQAVISETIGFRRFAEVGVVTATAARATVDLQVAQRGLVTTTVGLYFTVAASQRKRELLEEAVREAHSFTEMTQKREAAREVAHADVLKAMLSEQQRQRDLIDAQVAADKARIELGVLLFADPLTPYSTQGPAAGDQLPTREELLQTAATRNPELRSAMAEMSVARAGTAAAKAAYLPDLSLNFTYGIDAPQFAKRGPAGVRNLGYSIGATLDIPIFDWFNTQRRIQQSQIKTQLASTTLASASRRLAATINESYAEAVAARDLLTLLDLSEQTAGESLRLTRLRYAAGESTALEVVDAQSASLAAATAHADGIVRYQAALASIHILTGAL